jgi:hypothetical protein
MTPELRQASRGRGRGRVLYGVTAGIATGVVLTGLLFAAGAALGTAEVVVLFLVSIVVGVSTARRVPRHRVG